MVVVVIISKNHDDTLAKENVRGNKGINGKYQDDDPMGTDRVTLYHRLYCIARNSRERACCHARIYE